MGDDNLKGLTLREAVAADRTAIEKLADLTRAEHVARLPDTFFPAESVHEKWLDYLFQGTIDEKAVPFARLIVACLDDRVVGHVLLAFGFSDNGDHGRDLVCHVSDISVTPDLRAKGIGTVLMDRVKEVIREEQATRIEGYVWRGNEASHKLFHNAAFTPIATRYSTRLAPPVPQSAANPETRPSAPQASWQWLGLLALIVGALAWVRWGG